MPVADERVPLIPSKSVYDRFTKRRKYAILSIVALGAHLSLFTTCSFIPAVSNIANDLNTTPSTVNLATGFFMICFSFFGLMWATYSSYYGKRVVYLFSLPIFFFSAVAIACCTSIHQLFLFRAIQALGQSSMPSAGAAVVSDIFKVEERGLAMGIFWSNVLLAPAFAPMISGAVTYYTSWRVMQACIAAVALLNWITVVVFLPETSHPGNRGVEKARLAGLAPTKGRNFVWLNPFTSLSTLRDPWLLPIYIGLGLQAMTEYALVIPLPFTIARKYGIVNNAAIGALCFPGGIGNIIGAPLSGHIADRVIARSARKRGFVVYEDRLWACLPGLVAVPLCCLAVGLITSTDHLPGYSGLILDLFALFLCGIGLDFIYTPSHAYMGDVLGWRSAEGFAAGFATETIFYAIITAAVLPLIQSIGLVGTYGIQASVAYLGAAFFILVAYRGAKWRGVDMTKGDSLLETVSEEN